MRAYVTECSSVRSSGDRASASRSATALAVADASERLGRRALGRRHVGFQCVEQLRQRSRITPDRRGMKRRLPHALLTIVQRESDSLARRRRLDARERPHGVAPRVRGGCPPKRRTRSGLQRHRARNRAALQASRVPGCARFCHGRPSIVEQVRELGRMHRAPRESAAARVVRARRALTADAVNRAEHLRRGELRGGTTELVPRAGVDHEQAAVGILEHVGRVKIAAVRHEKIGIAALERRAARLQRRGASPSAG